MGQFDFDKVGVGKANHVYLRLPRELKSELQAVASSNQTTLSEVIRRFMLVGYEAYKAQLTPKQGTVKQREESE